MSCRRTVFNFAFGLCCACAAATAFAGEGPPPEMPEEVFLTPAEALREVFPLDEAPRIERAEIRVTAAERERIEKRLGSRLFEDAFVVHRGLRADGTAAGYAVVTEEIGKYKPITFIVGITPEPVVKEVAVLVYRESHGAEVKRRRFLAQFLGKRPGDPIKQNKDILNVSGATLSVRSVARGVRKVLSVVDEVLVGPDRRPALDWRPEPLAGAPPGGKETSSAIGVPPLRRARYLMGTVLEATVYPTDGHGFGDEERALAAAFDEVARLEALMSTFLPESELSRVNREAARGPVPVSPETFECVAAAIDIARRSEGAFDPTLRSGGFRRVKLDPAARTIAFEPGEGPPLALDLGGIAKGYALERAATVLRAHGAARALLNFGGQVLALEPPPGERAWIVAVEDPKSGGERAVRFFEVANASVATSSQAERPGHIIDPATGRPAASAISATVRAASATTADALATAAFVLGPERGPALVATEAGAEVLVLGRE